MTPGEFLNEFGAVANAPGGVQRLREMILQLAVQGKLVEQNPDDEPASELLKRIEREKIELYIHNSKPLPQILDEDKAHLLPANWVWCRLGKIIVFTNGFAYKSTQLGNEGIGVVKIGDIQDGNISQTKMSYINEEFIKNIENMPILKTGEIVIAMSGATTGKLGRNNTASTFLINQRVGKINGIIVDDNYLFKLLSTKISENLKKSLGSAIPNLSTKQINEICVPLPPLEEQKRIVAKVDQLMELCDQLEAQQQKRSRLVKYTRISALEALANAQGDELQTAWKRVEENLPMLFENPEDVEDLKKCVLQNAVMGKLVPQNPDDEPASELLKKIAKEKAELIKKGVIKKQNPLPEILEDEKPFLIPAGWDFAFLQNVCSLITDGTHQTPKYTNSGRPFISAQCVKPFKFMPNKCRYVSEEHYQNYIMNRKPERDDILLARVGAGIGEAALIDSDLEFAIYVSTGLIKPFKKFIFSEYLLIWLNSPIGRNYSERNTLGKGVSQGNLNLSLIRTFIVSIPPLEEQKRIVEKTQSLLSLCDTLQKQLAKSSKVAELLAQSIIESITGISTEKQEPM